MDWRGGSSGREKNKKRKGEKADGVLEEILNEQWNRQDTQVSLHDHLNGIAEVIELLVTGSGTKS
jgi:hypothetical protein